MPGPHTNLGEEHLHRVVKEYVRYYNEVRPHQGIGQAIPEIVRSPFRPALLGAEGVNIRAQAKIISLPVLGGLHHDYRRAA